MNVFPVNKMILVEPSEEQEVEENKILVPEDYKPKSHYGIGFVLDTSDDCQLDVSPGD